MAIDAYMYFMDYNGKYLPSESQVSLQPGQEDKELYTPFETAFKKTKDGNTCLFECSDYSFDLEQTLSIGSNTAGAGAGRVTFNPFSITKNVDIASPQFFQMACAGTAFQNVGLGLRKSSGGSSSGSFFVVFTFKLVAVKTVSWAHDDESPKETITFAYGGFDIQYSQQKQDGTFTKNVFKGWNQVQNIADTSVSNAIGGASGGAAGGAIGGIPDGI